MDVPGSGNIHAVFDQYMNVFSNFFHVHYMLCKFEIQ